MRRVGGRGRAAALAALAGVALARPAAGAGDAEAELESLRWAIELRRERVSGYERRERGLLETLEALDESAALLTEAERQASEALAEARAEAEALAREEERLARDLARTRRALAARAVSLYKAGELGPVRLLFSADSLREFLARSRALRRLLAHDRSMLDRQRAEVEALARARLRSREAAEERDAAILLLEARSRELRSERAERGRLLSAVRGDRERERAGLIELERAARDLEEKLASLRSRGPSGSFEALRGRLPPPVEAAVSRRFGLEVDREFGTETFHKGIDYRVGRGATVRAVADGTVRFAGRFRGYGNLVILDHGDDYFSVSAHLDQIAVSVGDGVDAGAVVGTAGETGSLRGPVLYFEVRRGAEALDPGEWLAAGREG